MARKRHSVLTDDLEHCIITGLAPVEIHHVFYGYSSKNRKHSERDGFIIPLTRDMHTGQHGIHFDKIFDECFKRECQHYFEDHMGTREQFIKRYGRSYL